MNQQQLKQRCRKYWQEIGITDEQTLKDHIQTIFERHDHQADVLIALYKLVLPDWDQIEKIKRWPQTGYDLWKFIFSQFVDFDGKHHPQFFKGGAWFDSGFSSNRNIDPWEISFENCHVTMK